MKTTTLIASACAGLLPLTAFGEKPGDNLANTPAGDWVMLTGDITEVRATQFHLDYERGSLIVELDDYSADVEYAGFKVGQPVMVYGRLDRTDEGVKLIEALQVYTLDTHKILSANPDDEEGAIADWRAEKHNATMKAKVTSIAENEMKVDTGLQTFTVNAAALPEPAFDDKGQIRIEVGDRVKVHGTFSDGFDKTSTLKAITIEELGE